MSEVKIRPVAPGDREACGRILYDAFQHIAELHNFPPDFPNPEVALMVLDSLLAMRWGVAAEIDGRVVGSCFAQEQDGIVGVGPISVDPGQQKAGVGRRLMQATLEHGKDADGIRLVQDSFNATSLSLYASLGFEVKEPLVVLAGAPRSRAPKGVEVRPLRPEDVDSCNELSRSVHGIARPADLQLALERLGPLVVEREDRVTGYATTLDHWAAGHGVAETEIDLAALVCGASQRTGRPVSFLLPVRQAGLFRWCLKEGLRIQKPMTLMAMGRYQAPRGCFFPSVTY